ncbi:uncharacterized protein [Miscanthus floridulus]|uniref:uncharacterized protein n=1 Tax=Miscanthus floridulus TaxID=154761 RepID=UPI003457717E
MDRGADGRASLLTKLGLAVLTCNSVVAAYRSWGDPGSLAFVAVALAYAALLLLLHFLRRFERAAAPADRGRAKAVVWVLSTLLTAMLAARVALLMPLPVSVAVWAVAAGGGFWALFISH